MGGAARTLRWERMCAVKRLRRWRSVVRGDDGEEGVTAASLLISGALGLAVGAQL